MNESEKFKVNTARDALSLLSIKMYEKFGEKVLPDIEEVWHKLGSSIGENMRKGMSDNGLASAGQLFIDAGRKRGAKIDTLELTDDKLHIKAYRCALGLKGRGRDLCHAVMGCDRGIFEGATGGKVRLQIEQTVAANDNCCEVIIKT